MKMKKPVWIGLLATCTLIIVGLLIHLYGLGSNSHEARLKPDASIVFSNGVTITAPEDAFSEPELRISIKPDPELFAILSEPVTSLGYVVRGEPIQVKSNVIFDALEDRALKLSFPLSECENPLHFAVAVYEYDGLDDLSSERTNYKGGSWNLLPGSYDEQNGHFTVHLYELDEFYRVFALVENEIEPIFSIFYTTPSIDDSLQFSLLSASDHNHPSLITPIQDSRFVIIGVGFDEQNMPPDSLLHTMLDDLDTAFSAWKSIGFKNPRLSSYPLLDEHGSTVDSKYMYRLIEQNTALALWPNSPDRAGVYFPATRSAFTVYSGDVNNPRSSTTVHELFHSVQSAYKNLRSDGRTNDTLASWGLIEGTAVLSQRSVNGFDADHRTLSILNLGESILMRFMAREAAGGSDAEGIDYRTQDFWAYLGKAINPTNPSLAYLIPLFEQGATLTKIHEFIQNNGTFDSLFDAYWQFAKNHVMEKTITYGAAPRSVIGIPFSHAPSFEYGFVVPEDEHNPYYTGESAFWESDQALDAKPIAYSPYFDIEPMSSFVIELLLFYGMMESHGYTGTVAIQFESEALQEEGSFPAAQIRTGPLVQTPRQALRYKFYPRKTGNEHLWEEDVEPWNTNGVFPFFVTDEVRMQNVDLLVSNTSVYDALRFRLVFSLDYDTWADFYADESVFPPTYTLTVLSRFEEMIEGVTMLSHHTRDNKEQTAHLKTEFAMEQLRPDDLIVLHAPEMIEHEQQTLRFSHWTGGEEMGKTRHIGNFPVLELTMDEKDFFVTAHYREETLKERMDDTFDDAGLDDRGESLTEREAFYKLTVHTSPAIGFSKQGERIEIESDTGHGGIPSYTVEMIKDRTPVRLTAPQSFEHEDETKIFDRWTGDVTSQNRSIEFSIQKNMTITAVYVQKEPEGSGHYLSVSSSEDRTGMRTDFGVVIESKTGHGGVTQYEQQVEEGTRVSLQAPELITVESTTKRFDRWSGDIDTKQRDIEFVMEGRVRLQAHYVSDEDEDEEEENGFTLVISSSEDDDGGVEINSPTGHGGVTEYTIRGVLEGEAVVFYAPEYVGSGAQRKKFDSWTIDVKSQTRNILFEVRRDMHIELLYKPDPDVPRYTLDVRAGAEHVQIDSPTDHGGVADYRLEAVLLGEQVILEAPEFVGRGLNRLRFDGWTGDMPSKERSLQFYMESDMTLLAHYIEDPEEIFFNLLVRAAIEPTMQVQITSKTGHDGQTDYILEALPENTQIHLEAPKTIGQGETLQRFVYWTGGVQSESPAIFFDLTDDVAITAHYEPDTTGEPTGRSLTVRSSEDDAAGVFIASDTGHQGTTEYIVEAVEDGDTVHLQAPEFIGEGTMRKRFTHWSGDIGSELMEISLLMDSDKTVVVHYTDAPVTSPASKFYLIVASSEDEQKGVLIESDTDHKGITKYLIEEIPQGEKVHLRAPRYIGEGSMRKRFTHWSGDIEDEDNEIVFLVNENMTVNANYEYDPQ